MGRSPKPYTQIDYNISNFDQYMSLIETNCSDFVAIMRNARAYLYRGVSAHITAGEIFKGITPKFRNPVDTDVTLSELIDDAMEQSGFKAVRHNSIYTTADYWFARSYGHPYYVFPFNGFDYTYSEWYEDGAVWIEKIEDLLGHYPTHKEGGHHYEYGERKYSDIKMDVNDILKLLPVAKLSKTHFANALTKQTEIMIANTQYYACKVDSFAAAFEKHFGFKDSRIDVK